MNKIRHLHNAIVCSKRIDEIQAMGEEGRCHGVGLNILLNADPLF